LSDTCVIIPARMASSRFPGKPLYKLMGLEMILHIWYRCNKGDFKNHCYIATCDEEIARIVSNAGGKVIFTSSNHIRATERVAEAYSVILRENSEYEKIIMVQGDEPLVNIEMLNQMRYTLDSLKEPSVVNLVAATTPENLEDPNCIKVTKDLQSRALYMSRYPIGRPLSASSASPCTFKQVCVIGFHSASILNFVETRESELERSESIDMLRFLENGKSVHLVEINHTTHPVDTKKDVAIVEELLKNDLETQKYLS